MRSRCVSLTRPSQTPTSMVNAARLLAGGEHGYRLLVENSDEKSRILTLSLVYAKGITRTPGRNSVVFPAPQAPVNRWKVRIPEAGVKVDIQPMIAATEVEAEPAADPSETPSEKADEAKNPPSQETVILAFVGAAPEVRIAWTPKAEGATGLAALASVQAEQQVFIEEGVTRTRTQFVYAISRAELNRLEIAVPNDQKVVNVFDANVRQWSVEKAGDRQKITVQLFEPAKSSQNVLIELERFHTSSESAQTEATDAGTRRLAVPVVEAVGVGRQQGVGGRADRRGPSCRGVAQGRINPVGCRGTAVRLGENTMGILVSLRGGARRIDP